ncbi:MAG: alkaline phosphatase family protein [Streptosporangiales bacterium]
MSGPDGGHVMVVGVDGVRFDFLGPDSAPSVWALGQAGFLAPVPVDEATPTWSGPCWATIATGTGVVAGRSRLPGGPAGRRPASRTARSGGPLPAVRPGRRLDDRGR